MRFSCCYSRCQKKTFPFRNRSTTVERSYYDRSILLRSAKYTGITQVVRMCTQAYERKHYETLTKYTISTQGLRTSYGIVTDVLRLWAREAKMMCERCLQVAVVVSC